MTEVVGFLKQTLWKWRSRAREILKLRNYYMGGCRNRILIFSHPRSASTTLRRALNCHPEILCINEPFHPTGGYRSFKEKEVRGIQDLDQKINFIYKKANGIKHVYNYFTSDLNDYLLTRSNQKVVYLWRKNILAGVVSWAVAWKTGLWNWPIGKPNDRAPLFQGSLEVDMLRERMQDCWKAQNYYRNVLLKAKTGFFECTYEDLILTSPRDRRALFEKMFKFLNKRLTEKTYQKIEALFHLQYRVTGEEQLKAISNLKQINDDLGSPETGYLF